MFKNLQFRYKVLLIPAAASIGFVIIVIVSLFYSTKNEDHLNQIGRGYVPALEMNRDLEDALEEIQRTLQAGVASLELEQIKSADTIYSRFIQLLDQGKKNPVLDAEDLAVLKRDMQEYYTLAVDASTQLISGVMDQRMMTTLQEMTSRYNAIKETLQSNTASSRNAMNLALEASRKNNTRSKRSMFGVAMWSVILLGGITIFLTRLVTKPILELNSILKDIAQGEGDLTKRITMDSNDEVGQMAQWFNLFVDKLHDIIEQVKANTEQVAGAAVEISSTATQMAEGAEEQTAQAAEVASSVEEMTSSIILNSQNATETAKIAEEAGEKANEGSTAMRVMRNEMEAIVAASAKTSDIIQSLSDSAKQIGAVIEVIDQLADQTNLLALNAAIEAARVGEQGRGFAVVADEVRKLAERTTNSTKEIAETILAIQVGARNAAESMKEANAAISQGEDATGKTEQALQAIVKSVTETMEMIQQIAAASEEQSSGAEEISSSVESIGTVTQETSLGAERMAAAAEELNTQTFALREVVDQFTLRTRSA